MHIDSVLSEEQLSVGNVFMISIKLLTYPYIDKTTEVSYCPFACNSTTVLLLLYILTIVIDQIIKSVLLLYLFMHNY